MSSASASSHKAIVPATTGADCDVPYIVPHKYVLPSMSCEYVLSEADAMASVSKRFKHDTTT